MPKRYALFGSPIKHSLSPRIHTAFAKQFNLDLEYQLIEAQSENFMDHLSKFRNNGGQGCNITLPLKLAAFNIADESSDAAKLAKSVNCFLFKGNHLIFGDNYDGCGLVADLTKNLALKLNNNRILIIGAGGATRGILAPLLQQNPDEIIIANRSPEKACALANEFKSINSVKGIGLDQLEPAHFDLVIHATSLGHQNVSPQLPKGLIHPDTFCYDLSYGLASKPFLNYVASLGAKQVVNGLGMLVEQAAASFYLWEGQHPKTRALIQSLRATTQ